MITIWTGNPRSGKTSSMVDALMDIAEERPIFVHAPQVKRKGVDPFHEHLKLPHVAIDGEHWHELVPDGAAFVVDEAQDLFRPRGPGARVPEFVRELETHGHRNIEIFLTTLKPRLLDSAVRDIAGRHIHIRDTGWLGRYRYEWPEVNESIAWKTCKLKSRFKPPKRTFGMYKSANEHGKSVKGKSMMPMIAAGLVAVTFALVFMVYRTIARNVAPPEVAKPSPAASEPVFSTTANPRGVKMAPLSAQAMHASFTPRITERPDTAPAYDELRKVVNMPRIVGGFCQGEVCRCYNQQNLSAGISHQACKAWIASPPFDPYYVDPEGRREGLSHPRATLQQPQAPTPSPAPIADKPG